MAKSSLTNLVNPARQATLNQTPAPLAWRTSTIAPLDGVFSDDIRSSLNSVATTLESVINTLDQIQNITETILRPVISILRAVEDPFSAIIDQILGEIEKFIQALENQGIYVLDNISPYINDRSTDATLISFGAGATIDKTYIRQFNNWILQARSRTYSGGNDPQRLEAAGKRIDDSGNVVDDEQARFNLTPAEIQSLADRSQLLEQAGQYIDQYNDDVIRLFDAIVAKYSQLDTGIRALRDQSPVGQHYLGTTNLPDLPANSRRIAENVVGIIIKKRMSELVDIGAFNSYINDLFTEGDGARNILRYTGGLPTNDIDFTSSNLFSDELNVNTPQNKLLEIQRAQIRINQFIDEIDKVEKRFDEAIDTTDKKKEIYEVIERFIRKPGCTSVNSTLDFSKIPAYNRNLNTRYRQKITAALNAPVSEVPADLKVAIRSLANNKVGSDNSVTQNNIIDTFPGFRYDLFLATELRDKVVNFRNRESKLMRDVIDFINLEIESQGRNNQQFRGTQNPRSFPARRTVPPVPAFNTSASTSSSETSAVRLNREDVATSLALLESISQQLENNDAQVSLVGGLRSNYRSLYTEFLTIGRSKFIQLQTALEAIQVNAQSAPSQVINTIIAPIRSTVQNDFFSLINAIISIKQLFYPFIINQTFIKRAEAETSDQSGKRTASIERLYNELIIGDYNFTPYNVINEYLENLIEILEVDSDIFSDVLSELGISATAYNPFEIFQDGFTEPSPDVDENNTESLLNNRIAFHGYFAAIFDRLSQAQIDQPVTFFDTTANGQGIPLIILQIIQRTNEINENAVDNLNNIRNRILYDLQTAEDIRRCAENRGGVELNDAQKKLIQDQIEETNIELAQVTARRDALRQQLNAKIAQIPQANSSSDPTLKRDLINDLNLLVEEIGGFNYTLDQTNQIEITADEEVGSINNRLSKLINRINILKGSALERDTNIGDFFSDTDLRSRIYRNISLLDQQISDTERRVVEAEAPGSPYASFLEDLKLEVADLKSQREQLNNLRNTIVENFSSSQDAVFRNSMNLLTNVNRAIVSCTSIIDNILTLQSTASGTALYDVYQVLLGEEQGEVITPGETSEFIAVVNENRNSFEVNDRDLPREHIVSLFQQEAVRRGLSGEIESLIDVYLNQTDTELQIQVDADVIDLIPYSVNYNAEITLPNGAPARKFALPFRQRLDNYQEVRKAIISALTQASRQNPRERNHAGEIDIRRQWIEPVTKDNWISELMITFRDERDIRRPVFIDDVSNAQPFNALLGENLGPRMQSNIDRAISFGEMTVVIFAAVSTDAQTVIEDIKNLYYLIVDPSKYQQRLNKFREEIGKQFGDLVITDLLENVEDFLEAPDSDPLDRILQSVSLADNADPDCINNYISQNQLTRFDRWLSIRLTDIFIIADLLDVSRRLIAKAKNLFMPKIGLADLLEDLLDFITERINILKKVVAGIGLVIELADFIISLRFNITQLVIPNVRSAQQLEQEIRRAVNFPQPFNVQTSEDPMYILSVVFVMPSFFFNTVFQRFFTEAPPILPFAPQVDAAEAQRLARGAESVGTYDQLQNATSSPSDITDRSLLI